MLGAGRLPLHIVVDRSSPCIDTLKLLLASYPEAAGIRRGVGRLAIHYASFCENPNVLIIKILLWAYPSGASTADLYGRLPLHYLLDRQNVSIEWIECVIQAYPQAASVADTSGKYPITIALERGHPEKIIKLLYDAHPRINVETGGGKRSLLLTYIQTIAQPRIDIVRYIMRVDKAFNSDTENQMELQDILDACISRKLLNVEREVLEACQLNNIRLRHLRWILRKDILLLSSAKALSAQVRGDTNNDNLNFLQQLMRKCPPAFRVVVAFV
jgi:hypothetical protein